MTSNIYVCFYMEQKIGNENPSMQYLSQIQIAFITWVFNDQVFSSNGNGPHFRIIYYIPEVK